KPICVVAWVGAVEEWSSLCTCQLLLVVALFNNHRSQVSYTYGVVPRYTRKDLWLICIGSRPRLYFHKWCATYASVISNDVHVNLVEPSTEDVPRVDPNDPDARIITLCPFYFSLGFTFPLSKFFKKVFCIMGRYEMYAQVRVCNAKLFDNFSQRDHVWHPEVLEVSGRWEGKVGNGPLVPLTYYDEKDNNKKLDLEPDMAKVCTALNILVRRLKWELLLARFPGSSWNFLLLDNKGCPLCPTWQSYCSEYLDFFELQLPIQAQPHVSDLVF
ncbi:unnamed protein product, partial [Prunus brigantina]